ncbi:MAG: LamG domain-containing protein [Victivallaceae bacterium]|jgi:hypothetical protein
MKFTNFRTIKLATVPATGDNPPAGAVYEWHTLDEANNLVINYRLSDGTDKIFSAWDGWGFSELPITALGSSGTQTINRSVSDKFTITPSGPVTLTTSNFANMQSAELEINNGCSYISYPSEWVWQSNTIPSLQESGVDKFKISSFLCGSTSKIYAERTLTYYSLNGNDSHTKLLINFSSFPFVDISSNAATITNYSVTFDTAIKKFGNGSAAMDNTGDYLSLPWIADYSPESGDFTAECWIKTTQSGSNYRGILGGNADAPWALLLMSNGSICNYTDSAHQTTVTVNDGNWHHVAWVRHSGNSKIYIDGTSALSWTDSVNYSTLTTDITGFTGANGETGCKLRIGNDVNNGGLVGNIDCVRISKGIARYTANFTPSIIPFQ